MDSNVIGLKVGLEVLKRTAPSALVWLSTYVRGIELLIVGPGGAGKTSISDYLELGIMESLSPHEKTLEVRKSRAFQISLGRDEALKLRMRRMVDVPGQTGPVEHANLVRERRPHVILIVLDGSRSANESKQWLDQFLERLDYVFRQDNRLQKKIRGIFVAINKRDAIRRKADFETRKDELQICLVSGLGDVIGKQAAKAILVMPTIAVQTSEGSILLDTMIQRIAKKVAK